MMELWDRRERHFGPSDKYTTFPGWISSSHAFHRNIEEPISWATAGYRTVNNRVNWTPETGLCPETEKQKTLMERQTERREQEVMVQRSMERNQWQPTTALYKPEKGKDGFSANSYGELEEWARQRYHHSLSRRRRLQGEMWSEIQNALKTERISGSVGRSVRAEPRQRPGINFSENRFNLVTPHQPPPYTSVKHDASRKMLNAQDKSMFLSSSWSQPPNYTPPPPYILRPDPNQLTGMLEPDGSSSNFSKEYRSESKPHNEKQMEHRSVTFLDRTPGTMTFPGSDRTQHQQELCPLAQQQAQNQQQAFTPQSSGHHEKEIYQTSYSDLTLMKPKRKRRSGGTVFCLVSHMGELADLSSSPNDRPLKCQSFPLLKSSTFTETQEQIQLAYEADSCQSLTSFNLEPTPEEPRKECQNHSDQNVRLSNHVEELRKDREELREQSNEKRCVIDLSKKKIENTDSDKDKDNIIPTVSSKSTTPVEPQHQATMKFPLWKEPKSHQCSNGVLKKNNKPNRSMSSEGQSEQSEPRNNAINDENTGLVVIDASCVVIKLEYIIPPEKEHVQYVSSCPTDLSKQSSDSNHDHKTTDPAADRRSEHKLINQASHTSSQVQPQHETLKERAERILGIFLQNSYNEAHNLDETTQMEDSRNQQIHDTSEGSAEAESEHWLKAECDNAQIPKTSAPNEEETRSSISEAEAMLEISKVTHGDAVNTLIGLEIVPMMSTKQENELNSVDGKFMLQEQIPTNVIDIKENQVKDSCDCCPSGESEDSQNLNQTNLRDTSETFSQKHERGENDLLHETDERLDLNHTLCGRSVENSNEPFSQDDTLTEGNSSYLRGDHVEDISDLPDETGDIHNPCSILPNSYEPDSNKVFGQEYRPSTTLHNLHRISEMFGVEGGHHQENLLNLQNLCSRLLSTSETLHQQSSPNQNLSYSGDLQVFPPLLGHHVENTNESFVHEDIPRGEDLSSVWPILLNSSVLNNSDTFIHEDILRDGRHSHSKHDANNLCQTLPGNDMENRSESCDHRDALGEGNVSGDVNNLHPSLCVKDIRQPIDGPSPLHEDGVGTLSSVLLGEDVDQCVYSLHEGKLSETTDMMTFSPDPSGNIEEISELFEHEAIAEKDLVLDDLQNLCPVWFGSAVEISSELFKREDNEGRRSPSPDLHMLSKEDLTSSLLSIPHAEISPHPPDCASSTFTSPQVPAACSSHCKPSYSLPEVTSVYVQVCSSVASMAGEHVRVKQNSQSLWDAVNRIRKHTAPDSETEDENGEFWESAENTEDGLINVSENPGCKEEGSELEESSDHAVNTIKDVIKEEERLLGERKDDDDSLSSSSMDSQDTVIEGEGKQNILQTNEEDEKNQKSDLFSENGE